MSHSKSFAESSRNCSLFAFIGVIRGLTFTCGGAALNNPWISANPKFPRNLAPDFL